MAVFDSNFAVIAAMSSSAEAAFAALAVTSRVLKKSKVGRSGSSAGPISYLARRAKSTQVR